jgi:hypothetical protein
VKGLKTTRTLKLPQRAAMQQLAKSRQTIADYAKVTPANSVESLSPMVQLLRKGK